MQHARMKLYPANRRLLCTPILCALALLAPATTSAAEPVDGAQGYYAWVLAHPNVTLPSSRERTGLAPLLAPDLSEAIDAALAAQRRCIASTPAGDAPDLFESNLFVGRDDAPTEVAYATPQRSGDRATIDVDLMSVDARFAKGRPQRTAAWRDRLVLRSIDGRWRVDDVAYDDGRSLRGQLREYVDAARSCTGHRP